MSVNSTILIGTMWEARDIQDLIKKTILSTTNCSLIDNRLRWEYSSPNYQCASFMHGGFSVLLHLHLNTKFCGIECHHVAVQNGSDNVEVMSILTEIVRSTGGLFQRIEGRELIIFNDSYTEDDGFTSRRKFLGLEYDF